MREISSDFVVKSSGVKLTTKNAWALYARRRWKDGNGVKCAMAEWGLTEGEAKGLFAGQISQPTIEKINDHPRGGMRLSILITEIRFQTALRAFVQSEHERGAHEAKLHADDMAALAEMGRRLPAHFGLGGGGAAGFHPVEPGALPADWSRPCRAGDRSPGRLTP